MKKIIIVLFLLLACTVYAQNSHTAVEDEQLVIIEDLPILVEDYALIDIRANTHEKLVVSLHLHQIIFFAILAIIATFFAYYLGKKRSIEIQG